MKRLTGEELKKEINKDPCWCLNIKEPLEITTYADLSYTKIKTLSPFLHFIGRNDLGWVANLDSCNINTAEGIFDGAVFFNNSHITKIGDLKITSTSTGGDAAFFTGCKSLKIASGDFPGFVCFARSGITSVENINIHKENKYGVTLNLNFCDKLKRVQGEIPGLVTIENSSVEDLSNLKITKPNKNGEKIIIIGCPALTINKLPIEIQNIKKDMDINGEKGYIIDNMLKIRISNRNSQEKSKKDKIKALVKELGGDKSVNI